MNILLLPHLTSAHITSSVERLLSEDGANEPVDSRHIALLQGAQFCVTMIRLDVPGAVGERFQENVVGHPKAVKGVHGVHAQQQKEGHGDHASAEEVGAERGQPCPQLLVSMVRCINDHNIPHSLQYPSCS